MWIALYKGTIRMQDGWISWCMQNLLHICIAMLLLMAFIKCRVVRIFMFTILPLELSNAPLYLTFQLPTINDICAFIFYLYGVHFAAFCKMIFQLHECMSNLARSLVNFSEMAFVLPNFSIWHVQSLENLCTVVFR